VTIVCRSRLLPRTEPEVSDALTATLRAEGLTILDGVAYDAARTDGDRAVLTVTVDGAARNLTADHLVPTTGRTPNIEGLGLTAMGIETDARGAIKVGNDMATTRPGIYAAGDVTDRDQFVYMAAYGAKLASRNTVLGGAERYDNAAMPWVVFTDPQVAGVGLTEAREAGFDVKTSVLGLDNVPRALAARDTRGLIKLVADAKTDRLLGGVIMAPEGAYPHPDTRLWPSLGSPLNSSLSACCWNLAIWCYRAVSPARSGLPRVTHCMLISAPSIPFQCSSPNRAARS
jgi:mercuric reductase